MKFYSIVSGINYEITATRWEYHGPDPKNREKIPGISARFVNHMYDTAEHQKAEGWSDETREMVETALQNHENFNTQWLQIVPETEAESRSKEFTDTGRCISRTVTDEGVVDCEDQALEGEFYCRRHLPALEKVVG